jgi:hypothetical protein
LSWYRGRVGHEFSGSTGSTVTKVETKSRQIQ